MNFLIAAIAVTNAVAGGMAHITSESTFYDRKEGYAYFRGKVHVDDKEYQLHADKAFVFFDGTNSLKRIVAIGHVAMTNGTKRAYGDKASYYRGPGMVVLSSGNGIGATVCDETPKGEQKVVGEKIRFWTGSQQVEVIKATISAPTEGTFEGLKEKLGK